MDRTTLKIVENLVDIGKLIIVEGIISVGSQVLRESSKSHYKRIGEDTRQNVNLIKNKVNGRKVDRYSDLE